MESTRTIGKDKAPKTKEKAKAKKNQTVLTVERPVRKAGGGAGYKIKASKGVSTKEVLVQRLAGRPLKLRPTFRSVFSECEGDMGKGSWAFLTSPSKARIDEAAKGVREASPICRIELERHGMPAMFVRRIAEGMNIPANRFYSILGVPRATANRQVDTGGLITGAGGYAAVAMLQLIGEVDAILAESTNDDARDFDSAKWLGQWIEKPQPALGGKKPAEILDTPTGVEIVSRTLGSISSGAYQ